MKKPLLLLAFILSFGQMIAQEGFWKEANSKSISNLIRNRKNINSEGELYFTVNLNNLRQTLVGAPQKFSNQPGIVVKVPNMTGELESYSVYENSNFDAVVQSQNPNIRAYVGQGITDKYATINFSVSPQGIQTMVLRPEGKTEFIEAYDKAATTYVLFDSKNRNSKKMPFNCSTIDVALANDLTHNASLANRSSATTYKTMRLALSCTAEYSNYFGATTSADVALVLAAMNATMTRVNGIMERDIAVHLNMIANGSVIFYDPTTDPYDDGATGAGGSWNGQLQSTLTSILTESVYDIGHLFGASGGGGNAGCIGCVCVDGSKGSGFTSPSDGIPVGDNFDIDFVIHEMGHQLGGNHTFSMSNEGTIAQTEPGSGSTIMGYAGITSYDVQAHSDALYSYKSILQIQSNLSGKTCPVSTVTTNALPVVSAGADYSIPMGTAFMLTGTATDADASDALTYIWEQNDVSGASNTNANSRVNQTKATGPNFRVYAPVATPIRYFPKLSKIVAGTIAIVTSNNSNWETVSSIARPLNFTFTARDNHPGGGKTNTDAMKITVLATAGPFAITTQNTTGIAYVGNSSQTISWNVLNSNSIAGGATVDLILSTDAGLTFPTVLATALPNNGSYTWTIPNTITSTTCRIMLKATANPFLAVNSKNFAISPQLGTTAFALSGLILSPNPNKGNFNVIFNSVSGSDIKIGVFDIRGRNIFQKTYSNSGLFNQNLQLSNVQSGVYLVNIQDGEAKVTKKIIIE